MVGGSGPRGSHGPPRGRKHPCPTHRAQGTGPRRLSQGRRGFTFWVGSECVPGPTRPPLQSQQRTQTPRPGSRCCYSPASPVHPHSRSQAQAVVYASGDTHHSRNSLSVRCVVVTHPQAGHQSSTVHGSSGGRPSPSAYTRALCGVLLTGGGILSGLRPRSHGR